MTLLNVLLLALVQGLCELLPVSSSAHVILAERLLGLDPTSPAMTWLLVMLHTGTMFAVIAYFWRSWRTTYFGSADEFRANGLRIVLATAATGVIGLGLLELIKRLFFKDASKFEVEQLFGNPMIMACGLATAGILILYSAWRSRQGGGSDQMSSAQAIGIGAIQGLCLPFRGLSRSGATISTGLALGVARRRSEEFSFALAVVLTPAVVAKEGWRIYKMPMVADASAGTWAIVWPSLLGMVFSFGAGLLALRWLSRWLEQDRWHFFGVYCLLMAMVVYRIG